MSEYIIATRLSVFLSSENAIAFGILSIADGVRTSIYSDNKTIDSWVTFETDNKEQAEGIKFVIEKALEKMGLSKTPSHIMELRSIPRKWRLIKEVYNGGEHHDRITEIK